MASLGLDNMVGLVGNLGCFQSYMDSSGVADLPTSPRGIFRGIKSFVNRTFWIRKFVWGIIDLL